MSAIFIVLIWINVAKLRIHLNAIYDDKFILAHFGNPGIKIIGKAVAASSTALALKYGFSQIDTQQQADMLRITLESEAQSRE